MALKVLRVNKRIFDAFIGDGWTNWSRWYIQREGYVSLVGGTEPTKQHRDEIFSHIRKEMA